MLALIAFVLGLLLGTWAAASRLRGDRTWSEVLLALRGKIDTKDTQGGGGGPSEPL